MRYAAGKNADKFTKAKLGKENLRFSGAEIEMEI